MQNNIHALFSVSEVELIYRSKIPPADRPKIITSDNAFDIFIEAWDLNKMDLVEHFNILLLNKANHCIAFSHISSGGSSSCIVDPKIVFATALKANAASIIAAHNHPSGNLNPSKADIAITEKLATLGKMMDMPLLDHLIVTPLKYYSFAEEGLIL
ncbi:MAG TPA: JAB domain-containing protein [Ferruginibacter sp.]|nr:JAB domain-containing protein [Ferruginibacter sp.]